MVENCPTPSVSPCLWKILQALRVLFTDPEDNLRPFLGT